MKETFTEKRRYSRWDKLMPVKLWAEDAGSTSNIPSFYEAICKNISAGGVLAEGDRKKLYLFSKREDLTLELMLELGEGIQCAKIQSRIAWIRQKPQDSEKVNIGLEFKHLNQEIESLITGYLTGKEKTTKDFNSLIEDITSFACRAESSIIVKRNKEEVYQLLKDVEQFPQFMSKVKKVEVVGRSGNKEISNWQIDLEGTDLIWRQESIYDDENMRIRFRIVEGDFDVYTGVWTLFSLLTGTEVRLSLTVDWGVHSLHKYVGAALEQKTQEIVRNMLEGIRKRLWTQQSAKLVKFAFLVHPYDLEVIRIAFSEPDFKRKRTPFLQKIFEWSPSFMCSHVIGAQSVTGKEIDGELIYCTFLPDQLLNLNKDFVLQKIIEAGKIAEQIGARILGLGAYTAGVGRKGLRVAKDLDIPVTTGTSYTVAISIQSTLKAARDIGMELTQAKAVIIGATGAVGRVVTQILAHHLGRLSLVARNEERLRTLTNFIAQNSKAKVEFSQDIDRAISDADIIVTATSTPSALLDLSRLQPGVLICDISVPKNVSQESLQGRPDILVIEGGVVRPPGKVDFNFYFGLPPGLCYACMAETMILALEERYESYSIRGDISLDKVEEITRLGTKHGFELAQLRSFGQDISSSRIEQVKAAYARRKIGKGGYK